MKPSIKNKICRPSPPLLLTTQHSKFRRSSSIALHCRHLSYSLFQLREIELWSSASTAAFSDPKILYAGRVVVKIEPLRKNDLRDSTANKQIRTTGEP